MNTFWHVLLLPTLVAFHKNSRCDRVFNLTVWRILLAVPKLREIKACLPAQTVLSLTPRAVEDFSDANKQIALVRSFRDLPPASSVKTGTNLTFF
jgi:hypothetical protein